MLRALNAAVPVQAWDAGREEEAEWAEGLLGRMENAFALSVEKDRLTSEAPHASSKNAPSVEPRWYGHR